MTKQQLMDAGLTPEIKQQLRDAGLTPEIREQDSPYLAVHSTDKKFMSSLIKWLSNQVVEKGSTVIRIHEFDPYEEVDLLRAQIEGMTIRLHDAEKKIDVQNKQASKQEE